MGFWCSIGFSRLCFRPLAVKGEEGSARNPNTVPVCISSHLPRRQHLCRPGRCRSLLSDQVPNVLGTLGHLILLNTGHHVVTYLQDKVFGNVSFVVIQKEGGAHQTGFKACPLLTTAAGSGPLWAARCAALLFRPSAVKWNRCPPLHAVKVTEVYSNCLVENLRTGTQ